MEISKSFKWVSCFTICNKNNDMWKNYSNDSKGICIEYDANYLKNFNNKYFSFNKVIYKEKRPYIQNFDKKAIRVKEIHKHIGSNKIANIDETMEFIKLTSEINNIYITKTQEWEYENEYRIIYTNSTMDMNNYITAPPLSFPIQAIYLGLNFHEIDNYKKEVEDLKQIAKEKGFDIYEMIKSNTNYDLIEKPIYIHSKNNS